jgi:hypothetical protein
MKLDISIHKFLIIWFLQDLIQWNYITNNENTNKTNLKFGVELWTRGFFKHLFIYLKKFDKKFGIFFSLNSTLSFLFGGKIRQIFDIKKLESKKYIFLKNENPCSRLNLDSKSSLIPYFYDGYTISILTFWLCLIPNFHKTEVTTEPQFQAFD